MLECCPYYKGSEAETTTEPGTYVTMNHEHGALFGVGGMLSVSFFGLNGGLLFMTLTAVFPVGIAQVAVS
jgi:hypothetical protein